MLPEYLPGVHPLLVHFPIALLIAAVVVDVLSILARNDRARHAATCLLVVGTAFLPLIYWTGRRASDRVTNPFPQAQALMSEHSDLAWWTLWVFVAVTAVRLILARGGRLRGALHGGSAALLLGATILLGATAEHGGRLVFDLGVGVRPVREAPLGAFDPEPEPDLEALGPVVSATGGFRWRFREGAEAVLGEFVTLEEGELPEATVESRESALVLTKETAGRAVLRLGTPVDLGSMAIRVRRDEFTGTIGLALHVDDAGSLDSLTWDGSTIALVARREAQDKTLARAPAVADADWHEIELVAAGTHFRGYLDGELVVHGHGTAAPAGPAAIVLEGIGKIRLDDIRITPIDE